MKAASSRLLKRSDCVGFWEGPDFSRAVKSFNTNRASAPVACFRRQFWVNRAGQFGEASYSLSTRRCSR